MIRAALGLAAVLAGVRAQQVGTFTAETHPPLTWQTCTSGGCTTVSGSVVLDANWRWLHSTTATTNCFTGNEWDAILCPDPATCAENCALDGAEYAATYGITTTGDSLRLEFVTGSSSGPNVGSRLYLLNSNTEYEIFKPLNKEFTFDVDVSNLPCGLNGAVYFSQMDADGGMARFPTNKAGAEYGTGYCDSQCPRDLKFINGAANVLDWTPSTTSATSGTGLYGSCCNEMDIWEANLDSAAYTPHPCAGASDQTECSGAECGASSTSRYAGYCDPDGCDFNSYRMGNTTFYGAHETVDTTQPFTVVTQFITADGTDTGTLSEIKRFYVQNGVVIPNSYSSVAGVTAANSITTNFCTQQKVAFGDTDSFTANGGLATIGEGMATGMALVLSLWDDYESYMLWLDSDWPVNATASTPGVARGTCSETSGRPPIVEVEGAASSVIYSHIKFGTIGSTFALSDPSISSTIPSSTTTKASTTTTSSAAVATQTLYGQCAGDGYTGPSVCTSGTTCIYYNFWFSQCLS